MHRSVLAEILGLAILLIAPIASTFSLAWGGSLHRIMDRSLASHQATASSLEERYEDISSAQHAQQANYEAWVKANVDGDALVAAAAELGLELDLKEGHIAYASGVVPAPTLCFDLMYVRHGKTTGNTEPRVYQGYVDEPNNALNEVGLQQAEEAAEKLDSLGLTPDLVVLSPLSRAADTGMAFLKRHPELEEVTEVWELSHEMAFGCWDNVMVKDLPNDHIAHLFYLAQNAVVKADGPFVSPTGLFKDKDIPVENFVEVLVRMNKFLTLLNSRMEEKQSSLASDGGDGDGGGDGGGGGGAKTRRSKRPLVLVYGHSMAGAALGVLTGNGKTVEGEKYLGFDGKYIMPNATPVFLHKG